ncbi:MAG: benzoyl-CoA reductase subunit C, partial [Alphaproteobacteria bacterium]|nr:benzoyl-CoA reductase subunit C [Alphaproteobacteria bacterium]
YAFRAKEPWLAPSSEVYLLMRAGLVLPVEEHSRMMCDYMAAAKKENRPKRDNSRVVVTGSFCEQPPLNLIKSIELAGCYIVDDDLLLVNRWEKSDVAETGDPIAALVKSYLTDSLDTASKYEPDVDHKGMFLVESVKKYGAEGVIFAAPSFCDPALLDRPMLQRTLAKHNVPFIAFKYAENSGQMQPIREQAGTFADSIKLWSEA